jgi:hypothetical protein
LKAAGGKIPPYAEKQSQAPVDHSETRASGGAN